jgi:hypothetical protein
VRAAAQLEILYRARAAGGKWLDVMELQERGLITPPSLSGERTATFVAPPDGAPDGARNSPRTSASWRGLAMALPAPLRGRELRSLCLGYKEGERPIDEGRSVAAWYLVPKQRSRPLELAAGLFTNGDSKQMAGGRQRRDDRTPRRIGANDGNCARRT